MIGLTSAEAERAYLGALLSGAAVDDTVRGGDFAEPMHELVFDAIQRVAQTGSRPDMVNVRVSIGQPFIGQRDAGSYLHDLKMSCDVVANSGEYAKLIADYADLRALDSVADRIRQQTAREDATAMTVRDDARTALDRVAQRGRSRQRTWADVSSKVIDLIEHGGRQGLSTPWPDLDRYIHGLVGSRVYLIAARPGEGKSLMAQGLATRMANVHRQPVLFASLEMSEDDLGVRIIAAASQVNLDDLQSGNLSERNWAKVAAGQASLDQMPLIIDDASDQTIGHIRSAAIDLHRTRGLGMVAIDYLQLMDTTDSRAPRETQVAAISRGVKKLSRELDVPVVALSQLNRQSLQRQDKRPNLGDLRESGSLEQDADVVVLMNLNEETGELNVQVAKNRHGPKGQFNLQLWGHHAELRSVSRAWTPAQAAGSDWA